MCRKIVRKFLSECVCPNRKTPTENLEVKDLLTGDRDVAPDVLRPAVNII